MKKEAEAGWVEFCEVARIRYDGDYAGAVRPAFDAGMECGHRVGFAAGTNTKQNEASNSKFYIDQVRARLLAAYGMGPECTWFDIAGTAEHAMTQLNAMRDAMQQFCQRVDKGEVRSVRTYALFTELLAGTVEGRSACLPGRVSVDADALRRVLTALVSAPHLIREFQATREPVELFAHNPINILLRSYQESQL